MTHLMEFGSEQLTNTHISFKMIEVTPHSTRFSTNLCTATNMFF